MQKKASPLKLLKNAQKNPPLQLLTGVPAPIISRKNFKLARAQKSRQRRRTGTKGIVGQHRSTGKGAGTGQQLNEKEGNCGGR
jgi:hypothetical protein